MARWYATATWLMDGPATDEEAKQSAIATLRGEHPANISLRVNPAISAMPTISVVPPHAALNNPDLPPHLAAEENARKMEALTP